MSSRQPGVPLSRSGRAPTAWQRPLPLTSAPGGGVLPSPYLRKVRVLPPFHPPGSPSSVPRTRSLSLLPLLVLPRSNRPRGKQLTSVQRTAKGRGGVEPRYALNDGWVGRTASCALAVHDLCARGAVAGVCSRDAGENPIPLTCRHPKVLSLVERALSAGEHGGRLCG